MLQKLATYLGEGKGDEGIHVYVQMSEIYFLDTVTAHMKNLDRFHIFQQQLYINAFIIMFIVFICIT